MGGIKLADKILMKGNEAIGEAAIVAGCRHYFGYPIYNIICWGALLLLGAMFL